METVHQRVFAFESPPRHPRFYPEPFYAARHDAARCGQDIYQRVSEARSALLALRCSLSSLARSLGRNGSHVLGVSGSVLSRWGPRNTFWFACLSEGLLSAVYSFAAYFFPPTFLCLSLSLCAHTELPLQTLGERDSLGYMAYVWITKVKDLPLPSPCPSSSPLLCVGMLLACPTVVLKV